MAGPWSTEYRGSGLQPTMTSVDCTQTTSQEDMDMPLLCSTGSKYGAHERRTGRRAGPTGDFTRDVVMKSKKKTSYPTRTASSDSLGC